MVDERIGARQAHQDDGYLRRLAELDAGLRRAQLDLSVDVAVERAAGLLAGRIGGRVDDARTRLLQLAAEQGRAPHDLAAEVLTALEGGAGTEVGGVRSEVDGVLRASRRPGPLADRPAPAQYAEATASPRPWDEVVQQVLGAVGGRHIGLVPVRATDGEVVDFRVAAASPSVVDLSGRRGADLVGRLLSELYPTLTGGPVWAAWREAVARDEPREVGPFKYRVDTGQTAVELFITARAQPIGPGLLTTWTRSDEVDQLAERTAQTERLGNLGWGEWDLVNDTTVWSDGLYAIYERDPADGPLPRGSSEGLTLPEDLPVLRQAAEDFGRGQAVDVVTRVRVGAKVKYLRTVADAVRDIEGRPLKVYGIVQDVTAREVARARLAEVEEQLREHQRTLAAEHRLAMQLQHIVLPIPPEPFDLPGLRAAVRYLPAEQASRVGGDWFHAAPARDGSVVLAIGDVAGHGVQAAATMAQLRHALTALSVTATTDPAQLLGHLNQLLYEAGVTAATATAVVSRYEPDTGRLVWAQAGHPPLLHSRGGRTTELPRPAGPLLGALRRPTYRTASTTLKPGDLLLFYTDGLIEHRNRSFAEGLDPVVATLDRITAEARQQPLAELLGRLRRANPDDDTCILAVRPLAAPDGGLPARSGGQP